MSYLICIAFSVLFPVSDELRPSDGDATGLVAECSAD